MGRSVPPRRPVTLELELESESPHCRYAAAALALAALRGPARLPGSRDAEGQAAAGRAGPAGGKRDPRRILDIRQLHGPCQCSRLRASKLKLILHY